MPTEEQGEDCGVGDDGSSGGEEEREKVTTTTGGSGITSTNTNPVFALMLKKTTGVVVPAMSTLHIPVSMHACMRVRIYAFMDIYTCINICMSTYLCTY